MSILVKKIICQLARHTKLRRKFDARLFENEAILYRALAKMSHLYHITFQLYQLSQIPQVMKYNRKCSVFTAKDTSVDRLQRRRRFENFWIISKSFSRSFCADKTFIGTTFRFSRGFYANITWTTRFEVGSLWVSAIARWYWRIRIRISTNIPWIT